MAIAIGRLQRLQQETLTAHQWPVVTGDATNSQVGEHRACNHDSSAAFVGRRQAKTV